MKGRLKNKAEQKSFKFRTCGGHDRSADCMRRRKQRSRQSCSECKSSVHRFHYTEYGRYAGRLYGPDGEHQGADQPYGYRGHGVQGICRAVYGAVPEHYRRI